MCSDRICSLYSPVYSDSPLPFRNPLSPICSAHTFMASRPIPWSFVDPPGQSPLKKKKPTCASSRSHQWSMTPQGPELTNACPLYARVMAGLLVCRSSISNHSCRVVVRTTVLPCSEDTVALWFSPAWSSSSFLPTPLWWLLRWGGYGPDGHCGWDLSPHTLSVTARVTFIIPTAFAHLLIPLVSRKMEFLFVSYLFLKNTDDIQCL